MPDAGPAWIPYCGVAPRPDGWAAHWNGDPWLVGVLVLVMLGGWLRGPADADARRAGLVALAVTLVLYVSPLCALSSALFAARVVHHVLLATLLAPLLVAAFRFPPPRGSPGFWTGAHALVLWIWHAPPLYAAALSNDALFWVMQVTILGSATLWWAKVLRAEPGTAVLALLATMVQMGLLGAILTFAGRAYYAPHWLTTQAWGFSPMEDQQIAGIIMWAPAAAIYLLTGGTILYRALGRAQAA